MHHHSDQEEPHHHNHGVGMQKVLSHVNDKLPSGSTAHLGQRRSLNGGDFMFEVGLFIEYDTGLLGVIGGGEAEVVNYINSIVTGANIIYEVSNSFIVLILSFTMLKRISWHPCVKFSIFDFFSE